MSFKMIFLRDFQTDAKGEEYEVLSMYARCMDKNLKKNSQSNSSSLGGRLIQNVSDLLERANFSLTK